MEFLRLNGQLGARALLFLFFVIFSQLNVKAWQSQLFPYNPTTGQYDSLILPANDGWQAQPNLVLQDFSYAGYKSNEEPIPSVPTLITVAPGENIQAAIDSLSVMPKDANGFRGAVLLKSGIHEITNPITFKADGVVIRGEGSSNTFIYVNSNDFHRKSAISIPGAGGGFTATGNPLYSIVADMKMGDNIAIVSGASTIFQKGDHVILTHDRNAAFLSDHSMDGTTLWPDNQCLQTYYMEIADVTGDQITFTEPMTYQLLTSWNSKISKITKQWKTVGVEDLSIGFKQGTSFATTDWAAAIYITKCTDVWVRNVSSFRPDGATNMLHSHGIVLDDVKWATIENCNFQSAYNLGDGGNGYLYHTIRCDDVLFKDCYADAGRHNLSLNGSSSRIVFKNFRSGNSLLVSDSHRYLTRGILLDQCTFDGNLYSDTLVAFKNRGLESSGSGYTSTEAVLWNCYGNAGYYFVTYLARLNPHGRAYAIGTHGPISNVDAVSDPNTRVYLEGIGASGLEPASLFDEQLRVRLLPPNVSPSANAGDDQTITLPTNTTTLSGSGADPDGTIVSYHWTQTSGNFTATIESPDTASTPISNLVEGSYVFHLKVMDNRGRTAEDDVAITVLPKPNAAPVIVLPEKLTLYYPVSWAFLSAHATDPDGTIASYHWENVDHPEIKIYAPDSSATFISGLTPGTQTLKLTVTDDGGAQTSATVEITVVKRVWWWGWFDGFRNFFSRFF